MVTFKCGCSSLLAMTQMFSAQKMISPNAMRVHNKPKPTPARLPLSPCAVKCLQQVGGEKNHATQNH